jgi:hypothetical protein
VAAGQLAQAARGSAGPGIEARGWPGLRQGNSQPPGGLAAG